MAPPRAQGAGMSIDAIALVRVPAANLSSALEILDHSVAGTLRVRSVSRREFEVRPLEDGILFECGLPYATEPLELAMSLVRDLGEVLAEHEDPRGVYFFPSVADPKATTYEGVLAEVGEGGAFVRIPADEAMHFDPRAMLEGLGGMNADMLSSFDALLSDPRLMSAVEQVQSRLAAGEGEDLLSIAQSMAEQMVASNPELVEELGRKFQAGGRRVSADEEKDPSDEPDAQS